MKLKIIILGFMALMPKFVQADSTDTIQKQITSIEVANFKKEFCSEASKYQARVLKAVFIDKVSKTHALETIKPFKVERFSDDEGSYEKARAAHIKLIDKAYQSPEMTGMDRDQIKDVIQTHAHNTQNSCHQKLGIA